jgi:hypothetical protein
MTPPNRGGQRPKPPGEKFVKLTLKVPPHLRARLHALAADTGQSPSSLLRGGLLVLLAAQEALR